MRISSYVEHLDHTKTTSGLFTLMEEAASGIGYEYLSCAILTPYSEPRPGALRDAACPPPYVVLKYPRAWVKRYYACNYHHIDPVIQYAPQVMRPFLWDQLRDRVKLDDQQLHLLRQARMAGLNDGTSIPIRSVKERTCVISFAAREPHQHPEHFLTPLLLYAVLGHHKYLTLTDGDMQLEYVPALTARELECLMWIAKGKSSLEIGMILGICESTVNGYIRSIFRKLNVSTRSMAIHKANRLGLVNKFNH